MAQRAINELRGLGVGTRHIVRGGDRIGIYFLESGASQRASKVTYDRAHSAIAEIKPGDVNWDEGPPPARNGSTGLVTTSAPSDSAAAVTREACVAAKKHGLTISTDLNYRKKL